MYLKRTPDISFQTPITRHDSAALLTRSITPPQAKSKILTFFLKKRQGTHATCARCTLSGGALAQSEVWFDGRGSPTGLVPRAVTVDALRRFRGALAGNVQSSPRY